MQSSSLGRGSDECPPGSTGRGNRVSTIVRGSAAAINYTNATTDLDRIRRATFVKPAPVVPISVQKTGTMSRNNNFEVCSPMSISSSPSPSTTDPQYKRPVNNANSQSRPILLENGAKAYVTKDSIEVVSNVHVVRADSSRVDHFKTPMPKTSYPSSSSVGRRGSSLNPPSAKPVNLDVMEIGHKDVEVIEEKIISSSTVSSTTSSPSSRPAAKKGRGRPRKHVAKRSPPSAKGKF